MQKHTVAIIGLGRMGSTIDDEGHGDVPYSVAAATRASERLELVAGADLLPDKRDAFQSRWGVAVYEDFRDMIDREEPDLVAICTAACLPKPAREAPDASFRGDSHADLAVAVADMGVPMIYLEKAMASSMERADEIRDAVKRNNTLFNTGVLRRFDNRYDVVKDAVAAGQVGEVQAVIHYASSSLMHGHIHSIDTVSYLIGDPAIEAVRGELVPRGLQIEGNHIPSDPSATYQLRFANGVEAWSIPTAPWEFEIIGSEGAIRSCNNGASVLLRQPGTVQGRKTLWGRGACRSGGAAQYDAVLLGGFGCGARIRPTHARPHRRDAPHHRSHHRRRREPPPRRCLGGIAAVYARLIHFSRLGDLYLLY